MSAKRNPLFDPVDIDQGIFRRNKIHISFKADKLRPFQYFNFGGM